MSLIRSFVKDGLIYAIPSFITRGLSLFLVPVYTRVLSLADYGAFDLLMIFGNLVNLTVSFEVSQGLARYYTDEQDHDSKVVYASSAFWFTILCYTAFLLLALGFSKKLAVLVIGRDGMDGYFQIGMIYVWLNGIFYLIQNQFRWELRSKNYAVLSIIVALVTACLSVSLAYGLKWGLTGFLFGMVGGAFVGCVYGLWYLRSSFRFRFEWDRLKEMLTFSIPLVPSGISVFLSLYIDRLLINHYLTLDDVGLYGIGFRLASVVGLVMVGFQSALTPLIYVHYREQNTPQELAQIFRFFLSFALLVFAILSLFSHEILVLMTTPAFYSAAPLVVFLVPAILLSNMYIFAPGIAIAKQTHLLMKISLIGAVLHTLLGLLFIPVYGVSGAAVATLLGYGCVFAMYMFFSQRLYFVPHKWPQMAIAVIFIAILAYWIPHLPLPTGWGVGWGVMFKLVGVIVAILVVLSTGLIKKSELLVPKKHFISRLFLRAKGGGKSMIVPK